MWRGRPRPCVGQFPVSISQIDFYVLYVLRHSIVKSSSWLIFQKRVARGLSLWDTELDVYPFYRIFPNNKQRGVII